MNLHKVIEKWKKEKLVLIEMIQEFWLKHSCKCFSGHVPGHLVVLSLVTLQWSRSLRLLTQVLARVYCGNLSWHRNEVCISISRKFGGEFKAEIGFELCYLADPVSWELQWTLDGLAHLPAYWHNPNELQNSSMSPHLRGTGAFSYVSVIFILFIYDIIFYGHMD